MRPVRELSRIGSPMRERGKLALAMGAVAMAAACGSASRSRAAAASTAPASTAPAFTAPASTAPASNRGQSVADFYLPPTPLPPGAPGGLIRGQTVSGIKGVPARAQVWRILYHSRSIYGTDIVVSGYVIVPPTNPPAGGYPIVSWAHGTTGIADSCAPSMFHTGGGAYLLPSLSSYLDAGFLVTATDYEGLGTPGIHPYLLGDSEGRGVLDAARAAQQLPGVRASPTVILYGHSQGGHAALFAGELAPTYAPDLHVVGVVAAAPATDLSAIMSAAPVTTAAGTLSFQLLAAWSWANTYHDLPASALFTPAGQALASSIATSGCSAQVANALAKSRTTGAQLFQADLSSDPVVTAHARLNDPGLVRTSSPMLVVQGTKDRTVPPALTDIYVTKMACPIGDTVEYLHINGATHGSVPILSVAQILPWMADRLQQKPPPTTCALPGAAQPVSP